LVVVHHLLVISWSVGCHLIAVVIVCSWSVMLVGPLSSLLSSGVVSVGRLTVV
jgi:hypothetical protein